MTIIRQIPWTEQPQYDVGVDWNNPLTIGLVRLLVPLKTPDLYDCVTGELATRMGTAFATEYTPQGMAARTTATTGSYWTIPLRSEVRNNFSVGRIGVLYSGGQTLAMRDATAAGGTVLHWSNAGWDMRIGGTDYTAAGTHATGTTYVSMVTSSPTGAKTFVRGQGLVINGGAPGGTALVSPWQIHHNTGGSTALASLCLLPIWNRPLTDMEVTEWLANPWQLFTPLTQIIWTAPLGGAYTLNAETGAYTFTGSDVTLLHNYALTLESASYSLTGSNATLLKGLILDAASGSYTLTGNDATLVYNKLLNASSGSYSVTGADANLIYTPTAGAYVLNAESGAYVLTGSDVTFSYSGGTITLKAGSWIRYRIIT